MKLKMPCDIKTQKDYTELRHYIKYVTRKYAYISDYENLVSEMLVVFLKCCDNFDAKKAQLHSYAYTRFIQRSYKAINKHKDDTDCCALEDTALDTYPSRTSINTNRVAYEMLKKHVPPWLVDMVEQGKSEIVVAKEQGVPTSQLRLAMRYCAVSLKKRGYSV